jgi:Flp pilus assembly protein TadG
VNSSLRQSFRRAFTDESGAIAVIVALFLVALLVVAALVLDLGTGYDHDRELQAAADAGALAGVQELIREDTGSAATVTKNYVAQNVSPGDSASSVNGGNLAAWAPVVSTRSVTVDLRENHVPFNFAQIIGTSEGAVSAHAKAELMYLTAIPQVGFTIPYLDPDNFEVTVNNSSRHNESALTTFNLDKDGGGVFYGGTSQALLPHSADDYLLLLGAKKNGEDQMAPLAVGSVYVPASDSIIRQVELTRNDAGETTETVGVTVYTSGWPTDPAWPGEPDLLPVTWSVNSGHHNHLILTNQGNGVYQGSFTVSGSYINGMSMITIETTTTSDWDTWEGNWWHHHGEWYHEDSSHHHWHGNQVLAMFAMFDQYQSIRYFKQSGYTGGGEGKPTVSAVVKTRYYDMNGGGDPVVVSAKDLFFQSSFGDAGLGDMLATAGLSQEVQAALGEIQADPAWTLYCDTNGNQQADIGEWVPVNASIRSGAGDPASLRRRARSSTWPWSTPGSWRPLLRRTRIIMTAIPGGGTTTTIGGPPTGTITITAKRRTTLSSPTSCRFLTWERSAWTALRSAGPTCSSPANSSVRWAAGRGPMSSRTASTLKPRC